MEIINSQVPHKYRNRFLRDSGGGNVAIIGGNTAGGANAFEPHNLWGQYFDDTKDIDGDMSGVGNITATGDITTDGDVTATTANVTTVNSTTVNNTGTITTGNLSATTGTINTIGADTANLTTVNSTTVNSTNINGTNGDISNVVSRDVVTEFLTVTKEAHFFKLIIDELKSVGGQVILTAANATLDDVAELPNGNYRCYFKAKDATNAQIANQFIVNDQAICQTFNVASGVSYNVSNKYYWRLVEGKGKAIRTIDGMEVECHYIDLSDTTKDGTGIPAKGDKIAQLGYRGTDDTPRQSAIIISAYQSVDTGITPPYYAQYRGIDDFALATHRYTWFAANGNQIRGDLKIETGASVDDLIENVDKTYVHVAYANSSADWSKAYDKEYNYIGFCSDFSESDTALIYTDYTWARIKGADGQDGTDGQDAVSIVNVTEYYLASDKSSRITNTTVGFSTQIPTMTPTLKYLWNYELISYSDRHTQKTPAVIIGVYGDTGQDGADGADGADGKGISSIVNYYLATNYSSGVTTSNGAWGTWTTSVQTITTTKRFLWNYEVINYTTGNPTTTSPHIIGVYGQKGNAGATAEFYHLVPITKKALVDKTEKINLNAEYKVAYVYGSEYELLDNTTDTLASRFQVEYKLNNSNTWSAFSQPQQDGTFSKTEIVNYDSTAHYGYNIRLYDSEDDVYVDTDYIPITMEAGAVFEVTDDAITSAVQQSETYTDGQITTVNSSISQLQQTATSLNSTITQMGHDIDTANRNIYNNTVDISRIDQKADQIRTEVSTSITTALNNYNGPCTITTIDATELNASRFYPVLITLDDSPEIRRIQVYRTLDTQYGVPSYSTHEKGFVVLLDWQTKGSGWGANNVAQNWSAGDNTRYIIDYQTGWTESFAKIVGSIGQVTQESKEVVYVRGGSKYDVRVDMKNAEIVLYAEGYTGASNRPVLSAYELVVPVKDQIGKSEIVQTATNIQLSVYDDLSNRTGIDVVQGTITLDADNTTIVGNLNLTDTENGMTVFDDDGIPRINLQPEAMSTIATLSNDTFNYYTLSKNTTASKYDVTTNEQSFSLTQYETVDIDYFSATMYSTGSTTRYPMTNYADVTLIVTHPDSSITQKTISASRVDIYGRFKNMTAKMRFTAPTNGTYTFKFRIKTSVETSLPSGNTTCYAMINSRWQTAKSAQTYIGKDGFYTHAGANKLIWAGESETQIRYGFNGIRWNDADVGTNAAMEVIAGVTGTAPNYKPMWLPFYNFIPFTTIGGYNFSQKTLYIPSATTRYAYQIDATKMRGVLVISSPAMDSQGNEQSECWIVLPRPTFTYNGANAALPAGYTITIINWTNRDVFVTPYRSSASQTATIVDANRDNNQYCSLSNTRARDTYIFTGRNLATTGETWLSIHDTQ